MYSNPIEVSPELKAQILNRVGGLLLRRSINSQIHRNDEWKAYEEAIAALVKTIGAEQEWRRTRELLLDKWGMD